MEPFFLKNNQYFLIHDWVKEQDGLIAGFTTKNGGRSQNEYSSLNFGFHVNDQFEAVCENRKLFADLIQFPVHHWVGAEQTHEINILKVGKKERGRGSLSYEDAFKKTDGFFTMENGILLTLCFADCVPLFFYAPKEKAIGIAHGGWRGSVSGIAEEMIGVFLKESIVPKDILVVMGPSICENCYIVDDYVTQFVKNRLEDIAEKPYNLVNGNQYRLNLKELNRQILLKAGVPDENIRITNYCTSCHQDQFFSHRRDKGHTGRMMGFIGWKED
jgi:YfiH family protein